MLTIDITDAATGFNMLAGWAKPETVADIGSGIRPQQIWPEASTTRYDVWDYPGCRHLDLIVPLPELEADVITMLDVIEHLPKQAGEKRLREAIRAASLGVVVATPYGWHPQAPEDSPWPEDKANPNPYQAHLSGWEPREFEAAGCHILWRCLPDKGSPSRWRQGGWLLGWFPRPEDGGEE
ncbi:MAG: hypothetical protein ACPHCN_16570 [Mycobacterium sp.]